VLTYTGGYGMAPTVPSPGREPVRKAGSIREGTASIYEPLFKNSRWGRNVKKMRNRKLEVGGREKRSMGRQTAGRRSSAGAG